MWSARAMVRAAAVCGLAGLAAACTGGTGGGGGETATAVASDPAAVRQAIEAANTRAVEGWRNNDLAPMLANYEDGAIVMMPGAPAWRGRAALDEGMKGMTGAMEVKEITFRTDDVIVAGDYAFETGAYKWMMGPKGGTLAPDSGKYLTVWHKQADGGWKIVRDINNSDIAPAQ